MNSNYLAEAFQELKMLNEERFNLNDIEAPEKMRSFMEMADKIDDETIDIIDAETTEEKDLKDNYLDKVILDCAVCHSKVYKDPVDITLDTEDAELANVGDECPYCYSQDGYKIVGQIAPFDDEEPVDVGEVEPEEFVDISDDVVDEVSDDHQSDDSVVEENEDVSQEETVEESLGESINNINMDVDGENISIYQKDGKLTVETDDNTITIDNHEDDEEVSDETIIPVSSEVEEEIRDDQSDENTEVESDDAEFIEDDIDDFDEESFDELGESYLKKVYENVSSYKTTAVKCNDNKLVVEGVIKFNSGNKKATSFVFESKDGTKDGNVRFVGGNSSISEDMEAFSIKGKLSEKLFVTESFSYNYYANNDDGNAVKLFGTMNR